MKTVATIEARMKSSRLPGKVLLPILGKPMLEILINRLKLSQQLDEIIVATTINSSDDAVIKLAKRLKVGWYRGSEQDVLNRVLKASQKYKGDIIVELHGDAPMVDPNMVDEAIKIFKSNKIDYLANNTIKASVPRGFDIQIFSTKILSQVNKLTQDAYDHEHVSLYIYNHPNKFRLKSFAPAKKLQQTNIRLTVDTERDLELTRRVFNLLYIKNSAFSLEDVVELFSKYPQLKKINSQIKQKRARYSTKDEQQIKNQLQTGAYQYTPRLKAAIIGCGNIASKFDNDPKRNYIATHAGAYQTSPFIKLNAASDINPQSLRQFKNRWGIDKTYLDYKKLISQEKPAIISICTKPKWHYLIVKEAIKQKIKIIICEKPFGNNPATAQKLITKAKQSGCRLFIHYNRRFDPLYLQIQQNIKQGAYGKFLSGTIYYSNGFVNNGCHAIDLILFLIGQIKSVQTVGQGAPHTDPSLDVVLTLKNNRTICLQGVDARYNYLFEADFLFEKTRIKFEDVGRRIILTPSISHPRATGIKAYEGKSQQKFSQIPQSLPFLINNLVSKNQRLRSNASSSVQVLEIIAAALLSNQKQKKILLPLRNKHMIISSQVKSK